MKSDKLQRMGLICTVCGLCLASNNFFATLLGGIGLVLGLAGLFGHNDRD